MCNRTHSYRLTNEKKTFVNDSIESYRTLELYKTRESLAETRICVGT